jgi:hypothetical protein
VPCPVSHVFDWEQGYVENLSEDEKEPPYHTYRMLMVILSINTQMQEVRNFFSFHPKCYRLIASRFVLLR